MFFWGTRAGGGSCCSPAAAGERAPPFPVSLSLPCPAAAHLPAQAAPGAPRVDGRGRPGAAQAGQTRRWRWRCRRRLPAARPRRGAEGLPRVTGAEGGRPNTVLARTPARSVRPSSSSPPLDVRLRNRDTRRRRAARLGTGTRRVGAGER